MLLAAGGRGAKALSPRELLNLSYVLLMRDRNEDERTDLEMELRSPLDPMEQAAYQERYWARIMG